MNKYILTYIILIVCNVQTLISSSWFANYFQRSQQNELQQEPFNQNKQKQNQFFENQKENDRIDKINDREVQRAIKDYSYEPKLEGPINFATGISDENMPLTKKQRQILDALDARKIDIENNAIEEHNEKQLNLLDKYRQDFIPQLKLYKNRNTNEEIPELFSKKEAAIYNYPAAHLTAEQREKYNSWAENENYQNQDDYDKARTYESGNGDGWASPKFYPIFDHQTGQIILSSKTEDNAASYGINLKSIQKSNKNSIEQLR